MISIKKEIRLLCFPPGSCAARIREQKEALAGQGYLVVAVLEGTQNMETALLRIIRGHLR